MRKVVDKSMLGQAWMVATSSDGAVGADDLVKKILISRGLADSNAQQKFLNPSIKEYMPNPSVLQDMDVEARVIANAILRGEKIAV